MTQGELRTRAAVRAALARLERPAAWRHCVRLLTPLRPQIRSLARGLLAWPSHLPYAVAADLAGFTPVTPGACPGARIPLLPAYGRGGRAGARH